MQQPNDDLKNIDEKVIFLSNASITFLPPYPSTIPPTDNAIKPFIKDLSERVFISLLLVALPVITLLSSDGS